MHKERLPNMFQNVGKIDRIIRALLAVFLLWLGIFKLGGQDGHYIGVAVVAFAFLFIYVSLTGSCLLLKWLGLHTLTSKECRQTSNPGRTNQNL